jgi:enoyl-CoA hydratase
MGAGHAAVDAAIDIRRRLTRVPVAVPTAPIGFVSQNGQTPLLARLAATLAAAEADEAVRAVVLTGGPDCFAAGADIGELVDKDEAAATADPRVAYWAAIRGFAKPMVGAVNGWCGGGGNELAMACDIVVAGDNASFGQPEINLALLPGAGGTQLLPRLVGRPLAMKIVLSGMPLRAAEALAAGLVAELVPTAETIARALELATHIAEKSSLALRLAKAAVRVAYELPLAEGLALERGMLESILINPGAKSLPDREGEQLGVGRAGRGAEVTVT